MYDPNIPPTVRSFTDFESRQTRMEVRTCIPAVVESYDAARQRATVTLLVRHLYRDESGAEQEVTIPSLQDVPVVWQAGEGGYIHTGLRTGDEGVAMIADRSLTGWKNGQGSYVPYLPNVHNLADAIFLPGITPNPRPLNPPPASGTTIEGDSINLGTTATRGVARLDDDVRIDPNLQTLLTQILATLAGMQAQLAGVAAAAAAATTASAAVPGSPGNLAATAFGTTFAAVPPATPVTAPVPPLSGQINTASTKSKAE